MDTKLTKTIMRRVYVIYAFRRLTSMIAIQAYVFFGTLIGTISFVSISNVFKNMPSPIDVYGSFLFWGNAIIYTEAHVQTALAVGLVAFLFLLRELVRQLPAIFIRPQQMRG